MGLRSQCIFKLVTFVSSSCLQLQLQSTPSTSPRRISSGSSRRLSRTRRAVELYWYMLEIFTEQDGDKDGIVKLAEFPSMMNQVLVIPQKHGLSVPAQDQFETLFKKYDPRNDGRLTVDEWMSLAKEEVFKKFL